MNIRKVSTGVMVAMLLLVGCVDSPSSVSEPMSINSDVGDKSSSKLYNSHIRGDKFSSESNHSYIRSEKDLFNAYDNEYIDDFIRPFVYGDLHNYEWSSIKDIHTDDLLKFAITYEELGDEENCIWDQVDQTVSYKADFIDECLSNKFEATTEFLHKSERYNKHTNAYVYGEHDTGWGGAADIFILKIAKEYGRLKIDYMILPLLEVPYVLYMGTVTLAEQEDGNYVYKSHKLLFKK